MSKKKLLEEIIKNKILTVSSHTNKEKWILLKNGSRTPFFLDTSKFQSFPKTVKKVTKCLVKIIQEKRIAFDKILGLPYGGLMFGYNLANNLEIPGLSIRKEGVKNYSASGEILGFYKPKEKVLLIEDATVTAYTAIEFIKRIRKKGLLIRDIITIVDVGGPAKDNLLKEGVRLHSLFTWRELYGHFKNNNFCKLSNKMKIILDKIINNIKKIFKRN
jgi:orotate phosphoribosyltransferase